MISTLPESSQAQTRQIRVLVADDHSVVLAGLRQIIQESGFSLLGTAENGQELVAAAASLHPDIVVLDITMPILNGVEAARQIRKRDPDVKLVFVTMHAEAVYIREAMLAGANAYLLKNNAASELPGAIRAAMGGKSFVSPTIPRSSEFSEMSDPAAFGKNLSQRQREVLQLVAEGKSGKEIAALLNISMKTVEYHKANIMDMLGVRSTAELTKYAIRERIVAP